MLRKLQYTKNEQKLSSEEGDSHRKQDDLRQPRDDIPCSGAAELGIEEQAIDEVNDDVVGQVGEDREHLRHELYDDYGEFEEL